MITKEAAWCIAIHAACRNYVISLGVEHHAIGLDISILFRSMQLEDLILERFLIIIVEDSIIIDFVIIWLLLQLIHDLGSHHDLAGWELILSHQHHRQQVIVAKAR